MSTPTRIQRKRSKGWKMPPNTVYVGRPSKWGNLWTPRNMVVMDGAIAKMLGTGRKATVEECVEAYREDIQANTFKLDLTELCGKNLACWCSIGSPCHADVLLELANKPEAP